MTDRPVPDGEDDRRALGVVLIVVVATGAVDAACLLHLGVFTAYVTGSLVLFGAHLVGTPGSPTPSAVALVAFVAGSVVGGALIRRHAPPHRIAGDVLVLDAVLVAVAAAVAHWTGIDTDGGRYAVIAILAVAMGCQTAAVRALRVADVPMAAGTLATFGLVNGLLGDVDSRARLGRRVGVVVALVVGAMIGGGLGRWEPWASWAAAAVLLVGAAVAAYRLLPRAVPAPR